MFLDEHINRNFDKLNDNDLHIAHFINTHIDECKNMKIQDLAQFTHASEATFNCARPVPYKYIVEAVCIFSVRSW